MNQHGAVWIGSRNRSSSKGTFFGFDKGAINFCLINIYFVLDYVKNHGNPGEMVLKFFSSTLPSSETVSIYINSSHPSANCNRHLNLPSLFPVLTILVTKYKGSLCDLFLLWE